MTRALCNTNNLGLDPQQLLINKAVRLEREDESSEGALYPIMHIKAALWCLPSLTLTFKGAVDYTFMQFFTQMSATALIRRGFLAQLQVERFTDEYSERHLKGILGEGAVNAAPVVYDTGCCIFIAIISTCFLWNGRAVNIGTCAGF